MVSCFCSRRRVAQAQVKTSAISVSPTNTDLAGMVTPVGDPVDGHFAIEIPFGSNCDADQSMTTMSTPLKADVKNSRMNSETTAMLTPYRHELIPSEGSCSPDAVDGRVKLGDDLIESAVVEEAIIPSQQNEVEADSSIPLLADVIVSGLISISGPVIVHVDIPQESSPIPELLEVVVRFHEEQVQSGDHEYVGPAEVEPDAADGLSIHSVPGPTTPMADLSMGVDEAVEERLSLDSVSETGLSLPADAEASDQERVQSADEPSYLDERGVHPLDQHNSGPVSFFNSCAATMGYPTARLLHFRLNGILSVHDTENVPPQRSDTHKRR